MAEEENVDETVTTEANTRDNTEIDIKEEKTQAYKEKMKIDIENINIFEKRNKLYTTQWRIIYEVIELDFLRNLILFQMIL